jgi:hypothetical protein
MESFQDENSTATTATTMSLLTSVEEKLVHRKVKVTNLESGKLYFFQVVAGFQDVDGTPSKVESIFVGMCFFDRFLKQSVDCNCAQRWTSLCP